MTTRHPRLLAALAVLCLLTATTSHGARRSGARARTLARAVGSGVSLGFPHAIARDPSGALYVADRGAVSHLWQESSIVRIDPDGTRVVVADRFRGGGPRLRGVALLVEPDGQLLYGRIRIDPSTGDRVALALDGPPFIGTQPAAALPEPGGTFLAGGSSGLFRHDPGTGAYALVSGCASPINCVPVGGGPAFNFIHALAWWTDGTVLVAHSGGLLGVDLDTGERTLVSGPGRGTGPEVGDRAVVVEPSGHLLTATWTAIIRIDPLTGDRVVLSGPARGIGPAFRTIEGMTLEPGDTLAVADVDLGAVVRVDPITGDRSIVSGGPIGAGPAPRCANGAGREASGTVVLADCAGGILRVDLQTGDRSVVSNATTGEGPGLRSARGVAVEPSGTLLVADGGSVKRVHPVTGDRATLSTRRLRHASGIALEPPGSALVAEAGFEVNIPLLRFGLSFQSFSALLRLDLATGESEIVSGGGLLSGGRGRGIGFLDGLTSMAVAAPGLAAAVRGEQLVEVDLTTGDRRLVSGAKRGVGPPLGTTNSVTVDGTGTWWVAVPDRQQILRVDRDTGDRTLVSGLERGRGPQLEYPRAIFPDVDGTLIVTNGGAQDSFVRYPFTTVVRVDPVSGDRTVLSRY